MTNKKNASEIPSGSEIDAMFDAGEEVLQYFDTEHPVTNYPADLTQDAKRITLTMPAWIIAELDAEADALAISRNAVINTWLADRIRARKREPAIYPSAATQTPTPDSPTEQSNK